MRVRYRAGVNRDKPRVLFVSNSQGTAAGLGGEDRFANYPLAIEDQMPNLECRFWMVSDLTVGTVASLYSEIILQHRPHVVVLQCGMVESALRILPRTARELMRALPGGNWLTQLIYSKRPIWIRTLNRLKICFIDMQPELFIINIKAIAEFCTRDNIRLIVIKIPSLSRQFDTDVLEHNNLLISRFNRCLEGFCRESNTILVEPFDGNQDPTNSTLFLKDSVHFSLLGHRLVASNIMGILNELLPRLEHV